MIPLRVRNKALVGLKLLITLTVLMTTTSCWDEVDLLEISYISALGIDYVDNQVVIYTQLISFDSVAKKEGPSGNPNPLWIGHEKGETVLDALFKLMNSSQYYLNLDHLKTIVIHEHAFSQIQPLLDGINRLRASRFTSLMFGTKDNIEDLFNMDIFYNKTPITTNLYDPNIGSTQNSFIEPLTMQMFMRSLLEEGMPTMLPAMTIETQNWKNEEKPMRLVVMDGLFAFQEKKYKKFLLREQASGLKWTNTNFKRSIITVKQKEDQPSTAMIEESKTKMKVTWNKDKPVFHMKVNLVGHIVEWGGGESEEQFVKEVEADVRKQISNTYKKGVELGVDFYQLEHELYRYHNKKWKELKKDSEWKIGADDLTVEVKCIITHTGELNLES